MESKSNVTGFTAKSEPDLQSSVSQEIKSEYDFSRRKVLLADDDPAYLLILDHQIRLRLGCEVAVAATGDEALQKLKAEHFDILLTDMMMPGLHGLGLIREVRKLYPEISIMVVTGFAEDFPYVDVVTAGANDFIMKPHLISELEAKLIRMFRECEMREALVLAEVKYRSVFEYSMSGQVLLERDAFKVIDTNRAFCDLCGRTKQDLYNRSIIELIDASEADRFQQAMNFCAQSGQGTLGDVIWTRPNGERVWTDISVTFMNVASEHLISLAMKDVTERREVERSLIDAAQKDSLTGLLNKRTFFTTLAGAVAKAERESIPLSLIFIDLDNFKHCNDNYGHQAGDALLVKVGEVIKRNVRKGSDDGFRYGGDEFAVLLVGADSKVASMIGERMRNEFLLSETYGTSMSVGVAEFTEGMSVSTLVNTADKALYAAKASGKNTVCRA